MKTIVTSEGRELTFGTRFDSDDELYFSFDGGSTYLGRDDAEQAYQHLRSLLGHDVPPLRNNAPAPGATALSTIRGALNGLIEDDFDGYDTIDGRIKGAFMKFLDRLEVN